ncbi:hypothetical protein LCGC14_2842360 [marine sediment metagenome]|uniref:Uncharacterized protein n=1 Tax=marine sediment metagenome TaxID=412755 RepID=A0A0F9AJA0_9ZZZZ
MKKIKPTELKEGDFIRTKKIFDFGNSRLGLKYIIAQVKEIKINVPVSESLTGAYEEKKTIKIDAYTLLGDKISTGGIIDAKKGIYLMNKKERVEFVKKAILMNLEDKNE